MVDHMTPPLSTLVCFNHIETIVPITAGLSSQCYQVHADNKYFFAKQITTSSEPIVSRHAASLQISPKVIYYDQHWLITQFIDAKNLSLYQQTIDKKIVIAIKLMVQCHQITVKPVALAPKSIAHALIKKMHSSNLQQTELLHIANQLISKIAHPTNPVCCHGDLNFSNILYSLKKEAYLVDYECACTAPAEYDLAMFIAVNNLTKDKIITIVEHYIEYNIEHNKAHSLVDINLPLLNHYLQFCYFINGLWYMDAHNKTDLSKFARLAKQQWQHSHLCNSNMITYKYSP